MSNIAGVSAILRLCPDRHINFADCLLVPSFSFSYYKAHSLTSSSCVMKGSSILLIAKSLQRMLSIVSCECSNHFQNNSPSGCHQSVQFCHHSLSLRAADQPLLNLHLKFPDS